MPPPYALYPLPAPFLARLAEAFGRFLHAPAEALRRVAAGRRDTVHAGDEREALGGLNEHLLKDIGASSRLLAHAATRARDARAWEIGGGLY